MQKGFVPLPEDETCSLLLNHSTERAGIEEEEANGCMEKKNGKKSASQFS